MSAVTSHVSAEKRGFLGLLTLRRPEALNALDLPMVQALAAALAAWAKDDAVRAVAIRGEGPRAFCAGGDIRAWAREGADAALAFLAAEYRLNLAIATYPKPFLALMHGIVMGGGAGLSIHARHRLADPGLVFAMPETAIGFVPDVGASWFLPRARGHLGFYLALTAGRIGLGDAQAAGLVTQAVPMAAFDGLLERLAAGAPVEESIAGVAAAPAPPAVMRARLDLFFTAATVEGVLERLARDGGDFARQAGDAIRANAPTSLKLALEMLHRGARLTLAECLGQEYRAAAGLFARPDFREGVRAALIDRDRTPRWQPASLAAVDDGDIAGLLAGQAEISL